NFNTSTTGGTLEASTSRQYYSEISCSVQARRINPGQTSASLDVYILGVPLSVSATLVVEFETEYGTFPITGALSAGGPQWFSGSIIVPCDGTDDSASA